MRTRTLALACAALAALTVTGLATPARAAEAERKPAHCVGTLSVSATATISCYDSFTTAIAKATGGRVTDAPEKAETTFNNPAFAAKVNGSNRALDGARDTSGKTPGPAAGDPVVQSLIVEIDYDYWGIWGVDTLTWTAPEDCWSNPFGLVKYHAPDLTVYGWNDRINAFNNYSGCYSRHFEHIWFQGLGMGWDYGRHNLGPLDSEISSIQWT